MVYNNRENAIDSTKKQPEALYEDSDSHRELVIERKSIAWPPDYAQRHHKDHWMSDVFLKELLGIRLDTLYELNLPSLINGTELELRPKAVEMAQQVRLHWPAIAAGSILKSTPSSSFQWYFRKLPDFEKQDGEPDSGLKVSSFRTPTYVNASDPPTELGDMLEKIYRDCAKKFAAYSDTTRILVLDTFEDLRHNDAEWWQSIFDRYEPPNEINEIWAAAFDWITDETQDWMFELLKSR